MRRRHELSEEQWEAIRDRLPGKVGDPGRTAADNRLFVNAVLYVARTSIPWRDLPERLGHWNSVWADLADVLGEPDLEELHLDSSSVKAHLSACGSRREPGEKSPMPTSVGASAGPAAD